MELSSLILKEFIFNGEILKSGAKKKYYFLRVCKTEFVHSSSRYSSSELLQ